VRQFVIITIILSLLMLTGCKHKQADPPVIGVLYNLTGRQAPLDSPSAQGARRAPAQLAAQANAPQVVLLDGQTNPAVIDTMAQRLVDEKAQVIVGLSATDMVLAAVPAASAAGIPIITSGATSPELSRQPNVFLACFGDNVQSAAAAEYAYGTLGLRQMYLLMDNDMEYTRQLSHYFKLRFEELGGNVLFEDSYANGNFTPNIDLIKSLQNKPDGFFIAAGPDDCGMLVRQMRQAGFTQPILGGDAYDSPQFLQDAGDTANDVYFTTHAFLDAQNGSPRVKEFMAAYKATFGRDPENSFAALGYDAVMLAAQALQQVNASTTLTQALEGIDHFEGVTGVLSFGVGQHIPRKTVAVVVARQGKLALAAEVMPEKVPAPETP